MPRIKALDAVYRAQDFSQVIRAAAAAKEITQIDMAAALDITPQTMRAITRNPDKLTAGELRTLALLLGIPADTIIHFLGG